MAQIQIRDETRDRINKLIEQEPKQTYVLITQDYIITKALDLMEESK